MLIYKLLRKHILYIALPFIISISYGKQPIKSKTLTIMHLGTDTDEYDSIMDFIAELINERQDILPEYRINFENHYVQLENVGEAVKSFIDGLTKEPIKCAIIGPPFSSQATVVAETAKYFNLVQIGYLNSSPVLANKNKYPLYARTYDSHALNNLAIMKVIEYFGWQKIAAFAFDTAFVSASKDELVADAPKQNVSILFATDYLREPEIQMQQIKESDARIIASFSFWEPEYELERRIACEAYKRGMYGRRFQWLDWSRRFGVWREINAQANDDCTRDELIEFAEGSLSFDPKILSNEEYVNIKGATGKTGLEIDKAYEEFLVNHNEMYENTTRIYIGLDLLPTTLDAAWSLFLAMHESEEQLAAVNSNMSEFAYNSPDHAQMIYSNILKQQFYGRSGHVSFDKKGDRLLDLDIFQIRRGEFVPVGEYKPLTDELIWFVDPNSLFDGGRPPFDSDVLRFLQLHTNDAMFLMSSILAGLGMIYTITGCIITGYYRNIRYIKMSSPRINYMIALGCILVYIAVMIWGVDKAGYTTQRGLCSTRVVLLVCGFTFGFGSMFSKTWRVNQVVTTKTLQRKVIKDKHLFILVLGLLSFDILILSLWFVLDPIKWEKIELNIQEDHDEDGIVYQEVVYMCSSNYGTYWSGCICLFKGLLLMFGSFFAWQTRQIQIPELNDSKHIGFSVYNIMIASILTVPLVNILPNDQLNTIYGLTVISMLTCSTITVTLVFGTKIYHIIVLGNKVDDLTKSTFESSLSTVNSNNPACSQ